MTGSKKVQLKMKDPVVYTPLTTPTVDGRKLIFTYTVASGVGDGTLQTKKMEVDLCQLPSWYPATKIVDDDGPSNEVESDVSGAGCGCSGGCDTYATSIIIDSTEPAVDTVTSALADNTYSSGTLLTIDVAYDAPVTVTGTPILKVLLGKTALKWLVATTEFGSQEVGASVTQAVTNAFGTLATEISGSTQTIVVTSTNGVFDTANTITIGGTSAGQPPSEIVIRSTHFTYDTMVDGTKTLRFQYVVQSGDVSANLQYKNSNALVLDAGAAIVYSGLDTAMTFTIPSTDFGGAQAVGVPVTQASSGATGTLATALTVNSGTYELLSSNEYCTNYKYLHGFTDDDDTGGPPYLDSSNSLSNADKLLECMQRCMVDYASGIDHDNAFYVFDSDKICGCAEDSCTARKSEYPGYKSYKMLTRTAATSTIVVP